MTTHHHRSMPFGAELVAPGRTRFRLWAPSLDRLSVAIDGSGDVPMQPAGDGWFELEHDCGAGTRYRYRVAPPDGGDALLVPDPASRAQDGDVHDPSIVVDPAGFEWTHDEWRGKPWCLPCSSSVFA